MLDSWSKDRAEIRVSQHEETKDVQTIGRNLKWGQPWGKLGVDLEKTRVMENKFDVDGGDHDKAFMHVGDTDDIEDEDNVKEDQAVP